MKANLDFSFNFLYSNTSLELYTEILILHTYTYIICIIILYYKQLELVMWKTCLNSIQLTCWQNMCFNYRISKIQHLYKYRHKLPLHRDTDLRYILNLLTFKKKDCYNIRKRNVIFFFSGTLYTYNVLN